MTAAPIPQIVKALVLSFVAFMLPVLILVTVPARVVLAQDCTTGTTHPGDEAYSSQLKLQMPFLSGESWTVGGNGAGSFYGNYKHCNSINDHYATDWNRVNDRDAAVLAVADGTVTSVQSANPCPSTDLGCYVQITHNGGYRTTYGHLSGVVNGIVINTRVKTGQQIGKVGNSGTQEEHLHLSFRHYDIDGYYLRCATAGYCDSNETLMSPQGHKPSPMMTTAGQVNLVDGASYTSVNGRIYLPSLRLGDG